MTPLRLFAAPLRATPASRGAPIRPIVFLVPLLLLAGCSRTPPAPAAAPAHLGFLKGFTVEDASVREGDGGDTAMYVLMSSKTAVLKNIALAAGTELQGASVYVNDSKTLYWYRVVRDGRRVGVMVFHGSSEAETVEKAQASDVPTDTVKVLLSFSPALAEAPVPKP